MNSVSLDLASDVNFPLMSRQTVIRAAAMQQLPQQVNASRMPTGLSGTVIKGVWGRMIPPVGCYWSCQRVNTLQVNFMGNNLGVLAQHTAHRHTRLTWHI